jgi:hypothetical protein
MVGGEPLAARALFDARGILPQRTFGKVPAVEELVHADPDA